MSPPEYDSEADKTTVLEAGGAYEQLEGSHSEPMVMINLVPGTTMEPRTEQRFVGDAWTTGEFELDVPNYLTVVAETVEKLNGPLNATIVIP